MWPDVEALLVAELAEFDATVYQIGTDMPHPFAVQHAMIQIDVRAQSKEAARNQMYAAVNKCLTLPRTHPTQAGKVRVNQGPSWLAEQDGQPRYVTTVTVTSRSTTDVTYPQEGADNG